MPKTALVVPAHPGDFVWRARSRCTPKRVFASRSSADHPAPAAYAQEARIVAQAMGHKPQAEYNYNAPPVFLFEPHQSEMCNFKPQVILNIDQVWDIKRKIFEILAAQRHLWAYYERVALQRGMQGGRNSGKAMTYGEAYQRLFPDAVEQLA